MSDAETIAVYGTQAQKYADLVSGEGVNTDLVTLAGNLPRGGHVLDWGCGAGNAAAYLRDQGFVVTATDGTPEFAAKAKEIYGIDVRVELFADLEEQDTYDGIWASFSLLHSPKSEMPENLARAFRALKPGGYFTIGLKIGDGENRDRIGRFYAYYQEAEILGLLADAGFTAIGQTTGCSAGLDGSDWPWIVVHAHA